MNRNKKIDKINAYKKMLESNKLPALKTGNPQAQNPDDPTTWNVEEQIHEEFKTWAETQLAVLMGERSRFKEDPSGLIQFTDEEADVLKAFAAKVIAKTSGETRPAPVVVSSNGQSGPYVRAKQSAPARAEAAPQNGRPTPEPLGNRGTTSVQAQKIRDRNPGEPVGRVAKTKGLSLDELDQMADAIEDN